MIFDSVNHAPGYRGMDSRLDIALELMQTVDFAHAPLGRVEVREGVYYTVMDSALGPQEDAFWEHHNRYIDIQWVLEGLERIDVLPVEQVADWGVCEPGKDAIFSHDPRPGTPLDLGEGMFALFFPWDAHRCCISIDGTKSVHKVVIKIPV